MTSTVYYPGGYNPKLQSAKKRNNRTRTHQRPKMVGDHGPLQLPYNTFRVKEFLVTNVAGIGYLYGQPLDHDATETMTELSEEIEASFRDGQAAAIPVNQVGDHPMSDTRFQFTDDIICLCRYEKAVSMERGSAKTINSTGAQ